MQYINVATYCRLATVYHLISKVILNLALNTKFIRKNYNIFEFIYTYSTT